MNAVAQTRQAFIILAAVAEAVREAGRTACLRGYALLCDKVTLDGFQSMLRTLKGAGLIKEVAHELIWIGPVI